jgi:hypothetical protein
LFSLITLKSRVEEYADVKIPIKGVKYIHDIRRERVLLTVVPRPLSTDCIGLVHVPMQLSGRRQHASGLTWHCWWELLRAVRILRKQKTGYA